MKGLLMNPEGTRYSRKSITWAISLLLLVFIVARGSVFDSWPPDHIYSGLITLIVLVLTGAIVDKKFTNHTTPQSNVTKDI